MVCHMMAQRSKLWRSPPLVRLETTKKNFEMSYTTSTWERGRELTLPSRHYQILINRVPKWECQPTSLLHQLHRNYYIETAQSTE